jgi:hypothetical protein
MTVKILFDEIKLAIVNNYKAKTMTQKQLAIWAGVSERTINRVLNEAGVATAIPRLQGEAYMALQILKKHGVLVTELDEMLTEYFYGNNECQSANEILYPIAA